MPSRTTPRTKPIAEPRRRLLNRSITGPARPVLSWQTAATSAWAVTDLGDIRLPVSKWLALDPALLDRS